jgi:kynurenine aminotransferase
LNATTKVQPLFSPPSHSLSSFAFMTFLLRQHRSAVHTLASQLSGPLSSPLRRASPRILRDSVRAMAATAARAAPFKPAARVAGQRQDVWCVSTCSLFSPLKPAEN